MQNKGFVKVFAVLLTLVCLFYLSFSFVTMHYNKKAAEYANGDPGKESHYLDSLSTEKVWLGYTLKQCREMEVTLGLDLKGGMNVILELNVPDVVRSLSNNPQDANLNRALEAAYNRQASSQKDFIDLFAEEYKKLDQTTGGLSALFSTFDLREKITPQSSDADVVNVLKSELKSGIDNSFNVLRTRIDRFGVVSPNIQRLETAGRILVELPGVKEPERVRKLLQGSANLEFWETYSLPEIFQQLISVNDYLASLEQVDETTEEVAVETPVVNTENVNEVDSLLGDLENILPEETTISAEEFKKRNPLFGRLNPSVSPSNMPYETAIVGTALARDIPALNEYFEMKAVKDILPRNLQLKWGVKSIDEKGLYYQLFAIKVTKRDGTPALTGDVVTDAVQDYNQTMSGTEPVVSMVMNAEGAKEWARLTRDNIGSSIAIVLDDLVYSAPNVNDEITGGRSQISGKFTTEEAKDLANVLKSGKMAAAINIVQEDVVGPSLGQEAIESGVISFIIALVLLMIYMCVIYGIIPGMIANGALFINIFFTMGVLASFQAVLTLPGIAGMVLTLGMAVDANVLIYERIKEELRAGKGFAKSVADGYKNAFSAIFDSNLTSIITGIVLFYFGTGPIRGFATTLIIGLCASFFTAVFLTRLVYEWLIAKDKVQHLTFTTSISKDLLTNPKINFLGMRKIGYIIPAGIILLGAISMATIGLNNGIDFTGGRNYIVRFNQEVNTEDVRDLLADNLDNAVSVITIGTSNQVRISTNFRIADTDANVDDDIEQRLYDGLKTLLPAGTTLEQFTGQFILSSQKVGPSMADDIKNSAILAVIFAMICMAAYILIRFRDVAFSIGAFASVAVTTFCIISFYTLLWKVLPFSMEVDQTFIAAILTIIGYAINDTVVVFDRIRETISLYPKRDRFQVINDALNATLARTINTSLTTLVVVLCIFILGGSTIRSFTFAILLGIIVGTYCTLFIATPIAYQIQKSKLGKTIA